MYLLTFSFVIIGMLGIYTQVAAFEATQLSQRQTTIGQNMIEWHEAAMSLAEYVVAPTAFNAALTPGGCYLTMQAGLVNYCARGTGPSTTGPSHVMVMLPPPYTFSGMSFPDLPPDDNAITYTWNSLAFQNPDGSDYVLTYASPGTDGIITTPMAVSLGLSESDLYQQVKQSGAPPINFGYVSGGQLVTPVALPSGAPVALPSGAPVAYPVPSAVPSGSFGIITSVIPCNGC